MLEIKRASGVLLPVSGLTGEYSIGSLGSEAEQFIDWLAQGGFSYWQMLPFCLPDRYHSPYRSYSAFSFDPYLIDLPRLVQMGLLTEAEVDAARQQTPYLCEFDRLKETRFLLLKKAAGRFTDAAAIKTFLAQHPHVETFCRFMAIKEAHPGLAWRSWQDERYDTESYDLWCFTQYIFVRQWQSIQQYAHQKGVKLIGDMPIYVAYDSADAWAAPHLFELDAAHLPKFIAGVPPDGFAPEGQLWGNPLYDWQAMKREGYRFWDDRMTHLLAMFDGIRIDHFRGFDSYYAIPYGAKTAHDGVWRQGPGLAFVEQLRKMAQGKLLIAEDLGDDSPSVQRLLEDSGLPGMRVLQFGFADRDSDKRHLPHNYPSHCVAYTGTHDNNTLLGYVWQLDAKTRERLFRYCGYEGENWHDGCRAVRRTLMGSAASLVIFPLQDLLLFGADTRLNTPGTKWGNWGYRVTKEQLASLSSEEWLYYNRLYDRI